jgi:hypothetical protein
MKLSNGELLLGSSTILAVSLIPLLADGGSLTETVVLTAIVVTLLQGLLLAAGRARQRRERADCVQEVRRMLQDQVKGQLSRITMAATAASESRDEEGRLQTEVLGAVDSVTLVVDGLSTESLRTWSRRYRAANDRSVARARAAVAGK